jgi:alpha-methylacyl-CoA racemase
MGPLTGLRVVELAGIGPGPMCAMLLGDLGAEVIRIDRTQASGLGLDLAGRFDVSSRSRRSIALDLKQAAARSAAMRLIATADVLIEGWRPGVAERLGLGPEDCRSANPGLIYGRMTGYGQAGPLAQDAGHDLNYIGLVGALHAIGGEDQPSPPLNLVGDYGGGALYLAFGILAALFERGRSGIGQVVDAAMVDGASSLMAIFHGLVAAGQWDPSRRRVNLLDGGAPFYTTYACADGRWLAVGALEPKFFANFANAIGLATHFVDNQADRGTWPAMREAIAAILRTRDRDDWCALLAGQEVCVTPVLRLDEAARHPHAVARGAFVEVAGVVQPAPAPRFSRSPTALPTRPPEAGEHTAAILADIGLPQAEIADLLACGAAWQSPQAAPADPHPGAD